MTKKHFTLSVITAVLVTGAAVHAQVQIPNPIGIQNIPALIAAISTYVFGIVGSLAVIMFIWAGILFLTSGMVEGNLQKAKDTLKWAVIGLAIAISGAGLIAFIQNILGG
jgi:hypothetical protein